MGWHIELECTQTEVGAHSRVGYRSGDRLPVGHADAGPDWRPVVVEDDVKDDAPLPTAPAATAHVKPADPEPTHVTHKAPTSQTGANK